MVLANNFDEQAPPAREVEIPVFDASVNLARGDSVIGKDTRLRGGLVEAFAAADRRCRSPSASAWDFMARARLIRAMGDETSALVDVAAALELDPSHVEANLAALRWGPGAGRIAAASRLIAGDGRNVEALRDAIRVGLGEGGRIIHRFRPSGAGVAGWVAWAGLGRLTLVVQDIEGEWTVELAPDLSHGLAGEGYGVVEIEIPEIARLYDPRDGTVLFRRLDVGKFDDRRSALPPGASALSVIVPIYDGFEATRACLESLFSQQDIGFSVILVDDASQDPRLFELSEAAALRPGVTLLRNPVNLGFARSVNRALAICGEDDVLLINADTLLPRRAVARLRAVTIDDATVGTATPFSNNGQMTNFPRPLVVNALPSAAQVAEIAEAAWAANGADVVDLPTGIGFCLYITRACLDATGPLPERYGRGYYEDVEFCMTARKRGFRNVCATGVFVGHAGSLSFKADKKELTSRNLTILEERFPQQERQFLAFVQADPLRRARAAIEERLAPEGECTLLAASEGSASWQAQRRATELQAQGLAAIVLAFPMEGGRVELRRAEQGLPASLNFPLDGAGQARLSAYLRKLQVRAIELFDAVRTPDPLMNALFGLGAPIDLFCVDLWAVRGAPALRWGPCETPLESEPCGSCAAEFVASADPSKQQEREARLTQAVGAARAVRAVDRMGEAFAKRVFGPKAQALDAEGDLSPVSQGLVRQANPRVLGVLAPVASVESDRLLVRLSRKLAHRRGSINIVVLGSCFNEADVAGAGSTIIVGPADDDDHERLARLYGVGRFALFDRRSLFGPLDRLARRMGAPKAFFDWSFGALPAAPGDLVIDPRVCDEKAAAAVAIWLNSD